MRIIMVVYQNDQRGGTATAASAPPSTGLPGFTL
jgi:hypothetical protein